MPLSINVANRIGFIILGLTNNFAYVIMLSAAYDLIKRSENPPTPPALNSNSDIDAGILNINVATGNATITTNAPQNNNTYCNQHSTSAILLADTIPSLTTKILYPFLFVGIPVAYKASATAVLSAAAFLMTGLSTNQLLIYSGVACASFSSGLGESTYLSNSPLYGDVALSGWSMGTGAAGLVGAMAYALLTMILEIDYIMMIMLVVPVSMMFAYFQIIRPIPVIDEIGATPDTSQVADLSIISQGSDKDQNRPIDQSIANQRSYGARGSQQDQSIVSGENQLIGGQGKLDMRAKMAYLPTLAKYFLPLLLVYFAEYFINQGLFELIYYPEVTFLNHAAQYRWFQVTYQFGVMLSRSSLDLFRIKRLWTMSLLQAANALLFLAHVSKFIHIPSFYIVISLIVYEGLLGGFTYANTFYRMKKELPSRVHEFAISTVTIADTLGIVIAGAVALQAYNSLCSLYV